MKRQRRLIGIVLSGLFLAYFSASFIFVPKAPGLKDQDTSIVKLEKSDNTSQHGLIRSAFSEQAGDAVNFIDDETVSILGFIHTAEQQNQLNAQENSQFHSFDKYLSLRKLRI